jgi:hypothetical protein
LFEGGGTGEFCMTEMEDQLRQLEGRTLTVILRRMMNLNLQVVRKKSFGRN